MNNLITVTEKQVIGMVAKGYSTKMIASERNRSERTIEQQRKTIYLKLGASNCAEAISKAKDLKLI